MAVLVVVGVMNLVWMVALALVFLAEKNWRHGALLTRVAGTLVAGLGLAVLVHPELLTWLSGGSPPSVMGGHMSRRRGRDGVEDERRVPQELQLCGDVFLRYNRIPESI
jgi:hypothetical protein